MPPLTLNLREKNKFYLECEIVFISGEQPFFSHHLSYNQKERKQKKPTQMLHLFQETLKAYLLHIFFWSSLFIAPNLQMLPRAFGGINMKQKWSCFPIPGPLPQWQEAEPSGATQEGPQDWGHSSA